MSLYSDVSCELLHDKDAQELYRFQGGNSYHLLSIRNQNHSYNKNGYVYLSGSVEHHKYFMVKRLRQLINEEILKNEPFSLTSTNLSNTSSYNAIKTLILNSDKIADLYSTRLICQKELFHLIKENSFNQREKISTNSIERVDRKVYGGGYGLALEWRYLLGCLSYFTATTRINRNDLLDVVIKMKTTGKMTYKDHMRDIVTDVDRYQFKMNPNILSDFNKYEIVNILETLLEKGLVREGSELSENPRKVMREVVDDYERGREASIKVLEKKIDIQGD